MALEGVIRRPIRTRPISQPFENWYPSDTLLRRDCAFDDSQSRVHALAIWQGSPPGRTDASVGPGIAGRIALARGLADSPKPARRIDEHRRTSAFYSRNN